MKNFISFGDMETLLSGIAAKLRRLNGELEDVAAELKNIQPQTMQVLEEPLYFDETGGGSTDKMAVGHGKPPRRFVEMDDDDAYDELNSGAYMAHGDNETGGIIVGGDGIDMWAPPDRHLLRLWNEDESKVVASVDGEGVIYSDGVRRGYKSFSSSGRSDNEIQVDFDKPMEGDDYIVLFEFTRGAEWVDRPVLVRYKDARHFEITVYTNTEDEGVGFNWLAIRTGRVPDSF